MSGHFLEHEMAAIKKSVRLVDQTQATLSNLTLVGEVNWSGSINDLATQFELLVGDNTPTLTESEWNVFYCAYNGYMPSQDQEREARLLSWHISEGYQYDEQIRGFIGSDDAAIELIERVKSWSLSQKLAVIYKSKSYWRKNHLENKL